jgi:hypothetical protein
MLRPSLLFPLLFALAAPLVRADLPTLTVVGTDVLGGAFAKGLADFAAAGGLPVKLDLAGSSPGRESLEEGKADLGLLIVAPGATPFAAPFVARPVAHQAVVVVVPARLPLEGISVQQLKAVFGESERGDFARWGDLGLTGTWSALAIVPIACRSDSGITGDFFLYSVLTQPKWRPNVLHDDNVEAALKRLALKEGGIALLPAPLPADSGQFKVVPLAKGLADVAFGPTPDNLSDGDYPLCLTVQVVFRADAAARVLPLLRLLYGEQAIPLWQGAQFVPLPAAARYERLAEFGKL